MTTDQLPKQASAQLVAAAEQLVKAACSQVETTSISISQQTLKGIQKLSVDSTSVEKSVKSLKESNESKFNNLNQNMSLLKQEMEKLNESLVNHSKNQALQWAIDHAGLNSFKYYRSGYGTEDSSSLVKEILLLFRKGQGGIINSKSLKPYGYQSADNIEGEKMFRDALCSQIHGLTGQKPRISEGNNGYAIYYS